MWQGIDKRRFPRVNYPCRIIVTQKDRKASFKTQTENIGVGGVCVVLEKGFDRFTEVYLEIFIEGSHIPLKCRGRIVWVIKRASSEKRKPNQFDTGIEFIDLKDEDRLRIEKIVER